MKFPLNSNYQGKSVGKWPLGSRPTEYNTNHKSLDKWKTAVSPLPTHWIYSILALGHRNINKYMVNYMALFVTLISQYVHPEHRPQLCHMMNNLFRQFLTIHVIGTREQFQMNSWCKKATNSFEQRRDIQLKQFGYLPPSTQFYRGDCGQDDPCLL